MNITFIAEKDCLYPISDSLPGRYHTFSQIVDGASSDAVAMRRFEPARWLKVPSQGT